MSLLVKVAQTGSKKVKKGTLILGDLIGSKKIDPEYWIPALREIVATVNSEFGKCLLRPVSIENGDEITAESRSCEDAVNIVIRLKELLLNTDPGLKLRFLISEAEATFELYRKAPDDELFYLKGSGLNTRIDLLDARKGNYLTQLFSLLDERLDEWYRKNNNLLAAEFLLNEDYKIVAERIGKEKSTAWRRERSLKIRSYRTIRELIQNLVKDYQNALA